MSTIDKNSPYALFETDKAVEQAGVKLDYGPFYIQVARAGGANTRFRDVLRQRLAPHKRSMATETMSDELADKISLEVFAETVVLGWGRTIRVEGKPDKDEPGVITGRGGEDVKFSVEAVKQLFKDLPDLARDVMQQAQSVALFRASIAGHDAGN